MSVQVRKQSGGNGKFFGLLALVAIAGGAFIAYRAANKPAAAPPVMPVPGDTVAARAAQGWSLGRDDAPVVVEEFADFECPSCGRFATLAEPDLRKAYVETGKVKFVFYDFPLVNAHRNTIPAHNAAACAGEQGKFWPMHDALLERQEEWNGFVTDDPRKPIAGYAQSIGLDMAKWNACMDASTFDARIKGNYALGMTRQVNGTPTFFIDGRLHTGNPSYDELARAIDAALEAKAAASRPIPAATP